MRNHSVIGKLSLLSLLFGLARAEAATLYVSTAGSDYNPGSASLPMRTITYAYSQASAGTTIMVAPGTYTDYTSGWGIHLGKSGTASSPILLKSQVPGGAVIDAQNVSDHNVCFYIDGNYNILDGFEIRNGPKGGITIWSSGNQILNCNIHHNGTPASSSPEGMDGIYSDESTSANVYAGNYVHHNGRVGANLDHGLYLCGKNESVINNVILANGACGLQIAGYTTVSNLKVYNNVIAYNFTCGIILWQSLSGIDIKNNILYANGHYGIGSFDGHGGGVTVNNNLFFANGYGHFNLADGGSDFGYSVGTPIYSDPQLINETSSGFDAHLGAGSPAILAGLNLYSSLSTDMAGVARPASGAWDLGAYKYGSVTVSDTVPPTASLTSPANGATVSGLINVTCGASDNVGVASVQLRVDGANLGNALTAAPFTAALNTATYNNGSHALSAVVRDTAGNQTTTASITVNFSNVVVTNPIGLPTVSVAATAPFAVLGGTNYGAFTFTRTGSTSSALTVNYALGGTAVKWNDYFRYGVGDMPVTITIPAGATAYTMNIVARDNQTGANPETVTLALSADPTYQVSTPSAVTMTIVSNLPPPTVPPITLGLSKASGGAMSLKWNSVIGKTYRVASKSALTTKTWTDLSGTITATTTNTSWTDTTAGAASQRFYTVYMMP